MCYFPNTNGVVERFNGTIAEAIRTNIVGTDDRLWDHCAIYLCHVFQRLDRGGPETSPWFKRFGRSAKTHYFKRFGSLAYAKIHTNINAVAPKYERGIFLGYTNNGMFKVGAWRKDLRVKEGIRFQVIENRAVKVDESIVVRNIDDLKDMQKGTFVAFPPPNSLPDSEVPLEPSVVAPGGHVPAECAPCGGGPSIGGDDENDDDNKVSSPSVGPSPVSGETPEEEETLPGPKRRKVSGVVSLEGGSKANPMQDEQENPRVVVGDDGVTRKKRGRKPGTKPKGHWKKPGPKPKGTTSSRKEAKQSKRAENRKEKRNTALTAYVAKIVDSGLITEDAGASLAGELIDAAEDDGEALSFTVQVSRKEAFNGEDADKWLEADTLEKVQLEAQGTWRPVEDGELKPSDEVIPAVVIYTRKRCGRFKARLVALGNRQQNCSTTDIFSPTVSHAANRAMMVEGASKGHFFYQFDISNAFVQSVLGDERVFVRLPAHWSKDANRGSLVRLLRALYGLRISPRRWFDTYKTYLEEEGWVMCPREPGLFKKNEMLLTIYVDDSLLSGPDPAECQREMTKILARFSGKVIDAEMEPKGVEVRDILGATMRYCRSKRWLKLSVEGAISRMLKKFNMEECRPLSSPCVSEDPVAEGPENTSWPIRSCVGVLQHLAVVARCDIVFALQRVARCVSKPTENAVKACKRLLAYLKRTMYVGLEYSPENERNFTKLYSEIARKGGKNLPNTVAFTDSDFAGCTVTLRSTSGSIIYHRGTPIAWSSKRQTIRATSTCEAEYVGMYDTIKLSLAQGYLDWFLEDRSLPLTFCDNQSALHLSDSSLVNKKSKHMLLRWHMVRDYKEELCYVPTDVNKADPLTKALPAHKYMSLFKFPNSNIHSSEDETAATCFYSCCYHVLF